MFTGIVTHGGRVMSAETGNEGVLRLTLAVSPPLTPARVGDSICVQGTCLTVTRGAVDGDRAEYDFEAIPETLRKTTLGDLRPGQRVNLEAALKAGDALGGHWVQGHVDGVGRVVEVARPDGEGDVRLTIALPADLAGDVLPKGSVTVDGVSLTVGEVFERDGETVFHLYLIPHTLDVTTLSRLEAGGAVNLEMDVMGRWVAHHLDRLGLRPAVE